MHNLKELRKNLDNLKKKFEDRNVNFNLNDFKILKLGEGIEVVENDFAAEVAATVAIN
jgi:translation elongation factor EF-Ts